jgi:hypothetical protein
MPPHGRANQVFKDSNKVLDIYKNYSKLQTGFLSLIFDFDVSKKIIVFWEPSPLNFSPLYSTYLLDPPN